MEIIAKMDREFEEKYNKQLVSEAMEAHSELISHFTELITNSVDSIRSKINGNRVNIGAIVLSVMPASENPKAPSRSVKVLIGSLRRVTIPVKYKKNGFIMLPVLPPKDETGKTPATKKTSFAKKGQRIANTEQAEEEIPYSTKDLHDFSTCMVSIPKDSAHGLAFGDVVILTDVVAKAYYIKDTNPKVEAVAINVGACEKFANYTMADSYYSLIASKAKHPRLEPLSQKYEESNPSSKYLDTLFMLTLREVANPRDLFVPDGMTACPKYTTNDKDWIREDEAKHKFPVMKPIVAVTQWKGQSFTQSEFTQKIVIEFNAYQEALVGFYIANPDAWKELGPVVVNKLTMLALCQVRVDMTEKMVFNVALKRAMETGDRTEITKMGYDMGFVVNCIGILMDAPLHYLQIGIPITPKKAEEIDAKSTYVPKTKEGEDKLMALHISNLHSKTSKPPMICIPEYHGDKQKLWGSPDVSFVVVTNIPFSEDTMEALKTMTPEEGDELITCLDKPTTVPKSDKIKAIKRSIPAANTFYKYTFAIYKSRLSKTISPSAKIFTEGIKSSNALESGGSNGQDQIAQQPQLAITNGDIDDKQWPDDVQQKLDEGLAYIGDNGEVIDVQQEEPQQEEPQKERVKPVAAPVVKEKKRRHKTEHTSQKKQKQKQNGEEGAE